VAELAADFGYADQSYLNRETARLAGMTPKDIFAQLVS
jgi:AraC-like DNA-binding protein